MLNHNKSMLRVLLLVLSVLMVVSLAACGNDSSNDDMNAALSQAIADQQAALESQKKAQEDALAAQKAAQDAALAAAESERKAAEESLKAEADKAKKDAEAAEQAAKKAEESAKAAAEAQKKAEESMKKAEESRKKAESESAKKAEESRKAYESSIADSISAALATSAPETTEAPVSNTEAIKSVIADFSKLQAEYNANLDMYVGNNASEILMLFQKASIDLTFATTLEAAQDIYNQLVIDAEAVESVATVAADVQALIAALGDVETEVITTSAAKLKDAKDAWANMVITYAKYLTGAEYDADEDVTDKNYIANLKTKATAKAEKLGVEVAELNKADKKIQVLVNYIKDSLKIDIYSLYATFELDFDDEGDDLVKAVDVYSAEYDANGVISKLVKTGTENAAEFINNAYYKYQIISVVNGGDVSAADADVEWEWAINEETGKTIKGTYNFKAPIATVTAEEFIDVFAVPYLNAELKDVKDTMLEKLEAVYDDATVYNALVATIKGSKKVDLGELEFNDIDSEWDDIVEAFADELDAITFANTYKTKVTLDDAKADIYDKAIAVYVDMMAAFVEGAKEYAKEAFSDATETNVGKLEDSIDTAKDNLAEETNATRIERLNTQIAKYESQIAQAEADLEAFIANVDAAAMYTVEELLSDEVAELYKNKGYFDISDVKAKNASAIKTFIEKTATDTIINNFAAEITEIEVTADGQLGDLVAVLKLDLENLRDRLDPENYDEDGKFPANSIFDIYKGAAVGYIENMYAKTSDFAAMVDVIDAAIESLVALSAEDYTDSVEAITFPAKDEKTNANGGAKVNADAYKDWYGKKLYWQSEAAKDYALEHELTEKDLFKGKKIEDFTANYKSLLTTTANDYPLTYNYTAAEQACVAAQKIYKDTYTAIFEKLFGYWNPTSAQQKLITDNADYKTIKGLYSGDLKAEVEAFAKVYTDAIAKVATDAKALASVGTYAKKSFTLGAYAEDAHAVITVPTAELTTAAAINPVKTKADVIGKASNGDVAATGMTAKVEEFNKLFFVKDGTTIDTTTCNVKVLWDYKVAAVTAVETLMKTYKNEYKLIADTKDDNYGKYTVTKAAAALVNGTYAYDNVAIIDKISEKGGSYEGQLDSLLSTYIGKIKAVKLDSNSNISSYYSDKTFIYKKDSVAAGINRAEAMVNAYVVDLFGYDKADAITTEDYVKNVTDLYKTNDTTDALANYEDSRIYKAWYTIFDTSMTNITLTAK